MKSKMRLLSVLAMVFLLIGFTSAAMPPAPNYCEHMGYNYTRGANQSQHEGVCHFNENQSCEAAAFLEGECGQNYVKNISCRSEGQTVFTEFESCCGDMEPYLPAGASGQSTCQPEKSIFEKISETFGLLADITEEVFLG